MKKRNAFTLMEVLVATMIFSFVALSMVSVYYAANRNVLQNFRSDKLKSDVSTAKRAIANVMAQATNIVLPGEGSSGDNLVVLSNVSSDASPCCPMADPATLGAPAPKWHRFCIDGSRRLWYYTGEVSGCGGCPDGALGHVNSLGYNGYDVNSTCGVTGPGRILLANRISNLNSSNAFMDAFSRIRQPTDLTTTSSMTNRKDAPTHTRLVHNDQTINVFLNTVWNSNYADNATQTPVDYTLEAYFTVMQPR